MTLNDLIVKVLGTRAGDKIFERSDVVYDKMTETIYEVIVNNNY